MSKQHIAWFVGDVVGSLTGTALWSDVPLLTTGSRGIVANTDDDGTILVHWDNGLVLWHETFELHREV